MPTIGTRGNAAARGYGFTGAVVPPEVLGGMVLMTPTSIASTGTGNSSSIGANGSVTFSSCETLSLNGVFTSEYDNYMVVIRGTASVLMDVKYRLSAGGTPNSTASSYTTQRLTANGTTIIGSRASTDFGDANLWDTTLLNGFSMSFYGPYLAQPTAVRTTGINSYLSSSLYDYASTHNQSTAYDGFQLLLSSGSISGLVSVYGLGG